MMTFKLASALEMELEKVHLLDIGAMDEGEDRFESLRTSGELRVTGFEPDPTQFERLQANPREGHTYHPFFLGNGGSGTFHVTAYPGCSSLFEPDSNVIDPFTSMSTKNGSNFSVLETHEVETTRLDDVPGLAAPDLMKLDIQGGELDVLRHAKETLKSVLVIESEVEFVPLYKGQPLFGDMQVYLAEQGFVLHKFVDIAGRSLRPFERGGNRYAATSQVLWSDAIFVRDYFTPGLYTSAELLKAAHILNDVYASYDLVYTLLVRYDELEGADLSRRFGKALTSQTELPLLYLNLKEHV